MSDARFDVILLDLGGVLWHIGGGRSFLSRLGSRMTPKEELDYWQKADWLPRIDVGLCSPRDFASGLIAELGLPVDVERVLHEFAEIDGGLLPGALELLEALRGRFLRACLSNNNELHWNRLRTRTPIEQGFERCYLSHEIGLRKPDPRAFQYAVDNLGVAPGRILFVDDNAGHVEAARALGLEAHRALGPEGVREVLAELNVEL